MELLSDSLKQNGKKSAIFRISLISVLVIMAVICTFFDLQISEGMYGKENAFGKAFSYTFFIVGYVPAIFVDVILFAVAFWLTDKKALRVLFAFLVFSGLFGATYTVFEAFENVKSAVKFGVCGGVATLGFFPIIYIIGKLNFEDKKKLFYVFLIGAVSATIMIIIVGAMQNLWGRDRYYTILEGIEGVKYTAWYLPQGPGGDTDFNSFPSLHAASAVSMSVLMLLGWKFNFKKSTKIILTSIAGLIIVCVPLSRIVMGWHYATDVIFGLLLSYACHELGLFITDKIYRKRNAQKQND